MTPQDPKPALRAFKAWQLIRNLTGVLVIITGITTVVAGIVALINERDTWNAMKLPVALAIICSYGFVQAQKKILAMNKRNLGHRGSTIPDG